MRVRALTVAAVALVAATCLAGCRTNVGTAATVGGHRITESDVNDYVTPTGPDPSLVANAQRSGQSVSARSQVLQYLIQEQVFEQTLDHLGKVPSAGQLAALHDDTAKVLLQTDLTGTELDRRIRQGLPSSGIAAKFAPTFVRVEELEYALIQGQQLNQLSDLLALIKRAGVQVSVNPRYGKWDPSHLSLSGSAATPGYLSVQPGPPVQSTPAPVG